jgi:hypothetical protein
MSVYFAVGLNKNREVRLSPFFPGENNTGGVICSNPKKNLKKKKNFYN